MIFAAFPDRIPLAQHVMMTFFCFFKEESLEESD